jgi:N6-adenosine-specific RNA methylase IME4/ParB-like chromosome segregation protein Spo0J
MQNIEYHPIANCFPLIDGAEFDELVADIKANGVHDPVLIYEGMILDGRNRYRASAAAGVDCPIETYDGNDPVGIVVSLNLRRRHLSEGQRAWVAAQISNLSNGERASSIDEGAITRDQAADMLNVSPSSVDRARVVRDHGVPELQEKVAKGEVSPSAAADVSRLTEKEQQDVIARGEKEILAAAKAIRANRATKRRRERVEKLAEIAKGNKELGSKQKYPIIYADPPWRYENPPMGGDNRSIENHYPTMTLEEICALPVSDLATDDAILYLWATAPKLAECMKVIDSWGFEYRTNMVWDKELIGMGYHARNQHEILLISKRGDIPPPPVGSQPSSVHREKRTKHSAKPGFYYEMIEGAYPELPKIELFARDNRTGWAAWGNEVAA